MLNIANNNQNGRNTKLLHIELDIKNITNEKIKSRIQKPVKKIHIRVDIKQSI